ncbi:MAG TPA: hypothetical protein VFA68_10630 [Terriglobales bacterium]|nr:hypothetical protein [Terriglobales bacterium]
MKRREQREPGYDHESLLAGQIAACISILSFLYYLRNDALLMYGDAVAHMNIARRVIDSMTPGPLQLGTVWLPLPHILMIPFVASKWMWQTGIGGSVPSMIAYVLSVVGILRLVRDTLSRETAPDYAARTAGWIAALTFTANPNLIYLQTTAMTEPLCVALLVWSLVYFSEFVRNASGTALTRCGLCVLAACLTRYDGWFLSAVLCSVSLMLAVRNRSLFRPLLRFLLLAVAGPLLWLGYNWIIYQNPLEFANGAYSAKAIQARTMQAGAINPAQHSLHTAATFFLKAAKMSAAEGNWQNLWVFFAICGIAAIAFERRLWPLLLLWSPLPFYTLSLAYGDVPIYLPVWWPFSYYNVRFGIELLPAFAVSAALTTYLFAKLWQKPHSRPAAAFTALVLVAGSYYTVWRAQPITYREAFINSRGRIALEADVAGTLMLLPDGTTYLMYLGDHVGAMQRAGIPLSHVIHEGNHRTWKKPSDPEGLWERALADPARYADFVIAFAGDPVSTAVRDKGLQTIMVIHSTGQPEATIYRARVGR